MRLAMVLLFLGVLGVAAIAYIHSQSPPPKPTVQSTGRALVGGPFELVTDEGVTVTQANYADRPKLIYFGFSHCPDVCPTELNKISVALDQMAAQEIEPTSIYPLFITIDPERDTPQRMHDLLSLFHPAIVGLTGTPQQVEAVADAYRVFAAKVPTGEDGSYTMDHSSIIFLMDSKGDYVKHFAIDSRPEEIVDAIAALLG